MSIEYILSIWTERNENKLDKKKYSEHNNLFLEHYLKKYLHLLIICKSWNSDGYNLGSTVSYILHRGGCNQVRGLGVPSDRFVVT